MNFNVHHSSPVLFVSAMGYHILRLLTFRHDGTGLPRSVPLLHLMLALVVAVSALVGSVIQPQYSAGVHAASGLLMCAAVALLARVLNFPLGYAGYLFGLLAQRFIELGLHLAGLPQNSLVLGIWVGAALGALYSKTKVAKGRAAQ